MSTRLAAAALGLALLVPFGMLARQNMQEAERERRISALVAATWDQERVTAIALDLADDLERLEVRPPAAAPADDDEARRAGYQAREDIRLLVNTSGHLARSLAAGEGREATEPIYRRLESLRDSAEDHARRAGLGAATLEAVDEAEGELLELRAFYEPGPAVAARG